MPELPDVVVYIEALEERLAGCRLERVLIRGPFLLRSTTPPLDALYGKKVNRIRRVGKRIAIGFEGDVWMVLHLMIAGRLHWLAAAPKLTAKGGPVATFVFDCGVLTLTEAGSQHRASLHVVQGEESLEWFDAGGVEPLESDLETFAGALRSANHTLKRALTDPRIFSGVGNAYSDEILHRAQLSPIAMTMKLSADEVKRLYEATSEVLVEWVDRLRKDASGKFPEKVTAFRKGMAVHGRYGEPCPRCGAKVQRIRYAANETNYCAVCQTGGRLLADRSLSRLLHEDWPRTLEDMEELKRR